LTGRAPGPPWAPTKEANTRRTCYPALVPVRPCIVAFTDPEGFRHSVEVRGGSLYDAVALAIAAFREHGCAPCSTSQLEIEVRGPAVTHSVNMLKIREWANGGAKSPKEKVLKEWLKGLLAS